MLAIEPMTTVAARRFVILGAVLLTACPGKTSPQTQTKADNKAVDAKADVKAEAKAESGSDANADSGAPSDSGTPEAKQDLGERFRDPPWFRKTMLEGSTVVDTSRSEADEQGRFKSHILFAMPEGTTTEQCADQVTEKVKDAVANLERKVQDDGRINISGSTDRYRVSIVCGEAKGVMRAYVGYEWTS